MDIISYIAVALSLLIASPSTHSYFENAPVGTWRNIPFGEVCAPTQVIPDILAGFNPPEQIVETVEIQPGINAHLALAPSNAANYTVLIEFVNDGITCAVEIQGEARAL